MQPPDVVEALCERHKDMPRRVAWRVAENLPVQPEDLEPAAWEGLWRAATTWDPAVGQPFTGWAWLKIVSAIRDDMRANDPAGRRHRAAAREMQDAADVLTAELRRAPTDQELAVALGVSPAQLRRHRAHEVRVQPHESIEALGASGVELPAPPVSPPEHPREVRVAAQAAMDCLPARLSGIAVAVFRDETPYQEIAAGLGVSTSRVSQLKSEAVAMMRDAVDWVVWGLPGPELPPLRARRRQRYREMVAAAYEARAA